VKLCAVRMHNAILGNNLKKFWLSFFLTAVNNTTERDKIITHWLTVYQQIKRNIRPFE